VTAHSRVLSGLAAGTLYHYRVVSADAAGNPAVSGDFTLTTLAAPSPSAGLVGYWALDETAGTTAADSSGNGHPGTLINGPAWTTGRVGGALSFDGVSQSVSIPHSATLDPYPLTVAAWFQTSALTGPQGLVNKYVAASMNGYQIFMNAGSLCAWYFKDSTSYVRDDPTCSLATPGYADGLWHQVVFVVDAAAGWLYVDGVLKSSRVWTGTPGATITTQPLSLGVYPGAAGSPFFAGLLDDVRVYNRALGADEILALYDAGAGISSLETLTVTRAGTGKGSVTSDPAGIACPMNCQNNYPFDTVVALRAAALAGSAFTGWGGDAECTTGQVTMRSRKSCTATFTAMPDLTVTAVTAPASGLTSKTITVSNTVANTGGAAAGAFRVTLYMSPTDPTPGAGTPVGYRDVSSLAVGASSTASTVVTIPATAAAGAYYVSAVADSAGAVAELDETNNGRTAATTTAVALYQPDVTLTALTAPAGGSLGRTITVANTVRNQGTAPAGPFRITFYMSATDPTPGAGTAIGYRSLSGLAAGASSTANTALTIPSSLDPGPYYVSAVTDSTGALLELDATNDGMTAAAQMLVTFYRPDLVVSALSGPVSGAQGRSITIANTVRNQGTAPAGPFQVTFYLSPTDPMPGAGTAIGSRSLSSLAVGAASTAKTAVTIPATLDPGTYYLSAVADSAAALTELATTNNGRTAAGQLLVTYYRPDVMVTALTAPATGATGRPITVANTVSNQGTAPATAFRVTFYVSPTDPTPGAGTAIGFRDLTSLAAGAKSAAKTSVTIPATLDPGTYYLSAVADSGSALLELDATNDGLTATGQMVVTYYRPDLIVSALTAPATGATGQTITVPNAVRNQGPAPATAFRMTFYMSAADPTPGAGTAIGWRDISGLAAGASWVANTVLTIPAAFDPGTYYVSAVADSGRVLTELDATNNGRTAATTTTVSLYRPDVVMSALTAPTTGSTSKTIIVANTVLNQGNAPAGPFRITFYMSATDATPGAGSAVGSRDVASLAAGASSAANTTVTIPAGFDLGTYYVSAIADSGGALVELDATNNGLTAPTMTQVALYRPDVLVSALTAPATAGIGRTLSVSNTVRNQGTAPAGKFRVTFYMWPADPGLGTSVAVGYRDIASLAVGAASTASTLVNVPVTFFPSTYYLSAVADGDHVLIELDASNNALVMTAPVEVVP
jgi:subtilase family serine protease